MIVNIPGWISGLGQMPKHRFWYNKLVCLQVRVVFRSSIWLWSWGHQSCNFLMLFELERLSGMTLRYTGNVYSVW